MVTRRRLRSFLNALALYAIAALLIGYFGVNAYTGEHGLIAKRDLDQDVAQLTAELDAAKAERAVWQRRVTLLKSDNIDPDLLDERARLLLDDADPRDLVLMLKPSADDRGAATEERVGTAQMSSTDSKRH
jgi:cell division protein FtsB